ncbi:MAG: PLP-dependent aminotransferase family protein [Eubacteriales bacterium]|nr:PLP-dependent aminotransferase family protein [Eubacteriales bacterium]
MFEFTIRLDSLSVRPLYEQIYDYIKEEIQNGGLSCHERLPSTRKLAQYLDVSRSTVTLAYEQLLSEGYIENRPGSGFFVNDLEGLYKLSGEEEEETSETKQIKETFLYDFSPSGVDLESFPHNAWRKISRGLLMENNEDFYQLGNPEGEEELRKTIATYVHQARGVRCRPQQIVIGAGNDYLLMLLNAMLGDDRVYALENPTYRKAYDIMKILRQEVKTVEMDEQGIMVDELEKSGATVAYVMPSHHYPLGTVMPAGRRLQLLKWVSSGKDRYIIEDDYDSEFRYKGKPIPALQGFDSNDRVIYLGTFSKSIAPAIRISFLILPMRLMKLYRERGRRFSSTVSRMDQKILAEFIRAGYYERHLNRMRSVYKSRHDTLMECLKPLSNSVSISGEYAGTHLLLTLKNGMDEEQAIEAARKAGVRIYGLSSYYINEKPRRDTVILGYANLDEKKIREAAKILTRILK